MESRDYRDYIEDKSHRPILRGHQVAKACLFTQGNLLSAMELFGDTCFPFADLKKNTL